MAISKLRFIKRCAEKIPQSEISHIPDKTRGIYALLKKDPRGFKVVYIGMSGGSKTMGIKFRLNSAKKSKRKRDKWDYFSFFEVWDNISEPEVRELEGLIRHIYRHDKSVNQLNRQRRFKPLTTKPVRNDKLNPRDLKK